MPLSLQFIGCGDAFGSGGRFNTCFHPTGEQTNLLIDCGVSLLVAMKRLAIDRNAISTIVITHKQSGLVIRNQQRQIAFIRRSQ